MTEGEVEPGLHTNEEKMALWQMNRIAIDYKRGNYTKGEALKAFSYWAELPPSISWMLLGPMAASPHDELMKAFPKWITKDKEPKFDDASKATRARNLAGRKKSGLDAVGRPNSALGGRRRKRTAGAD